MYNETENAALLVFLYRVEIVTFPILILFGTICNITTFIVMRRRRMRVSSTCFYMAALAVTDTLVLWTGCLNQWFYIIHVPTVVAKSNFTCKLLPFLFVFFADTSVWIIVCMSFERYFAVSHPLRASQMCTTKRAKWVLLAMFIVFALIDGHFLLTLELEIIDGHYRVCHPKTWARHFVGKIFVFIDALKYSAIPFCILLILSILIIQRVFRAEGISAQLQNLRHLHSYRQYTATPSLSCATHTSTLTVTPISSNTFTNNARVGRRVTFMLLSVSIAFCVFSAPMSLMQIVQSIIKPGYYETPLAIGKAIAELCQYINHSCNFFLYALTGRVFRREFVRLFFPTRFGGGRSIPVATGMNGMGLSARAGLIPQAPPSSSHRGSYYSVDNNRYDANSERSSRRFGTLYPPRSRSSRTPLGKSPFLSCNNSPLLMARLNYLQVEKSSPRSSDNYVNNALLIGFWNKYNQKKEQRATRDDSLLSLKVLKANKRVPSTV
ncbi:unnamed protein product [Adineta ricciae]|uniref:G-protein coupled receptors family 1 profile domain-containing protein n=1 Tax=Adineta ricciae TaxID=249248 RepID=A0A815NQX9_ADIRI|nr:unnamed protein product [Adineta ricciae]CAF1440943.1 unnamed protein product [Adineta ricciae]